MDIGREYTERWHHQMQIRDAVGAPGLLQRRLEPLLDLSVHAFRRAYKQVAAPDGTVVHFEVDGESDYVWSVVRADSAWSVTRGRLPQAAAGLRTDADTAWKLLYNASRAIRCRAASPSPVTRALSNRCWRPDR